MPRRRMISPNIWKDPNFAKLTDLEKVLFIGIISNADDEGRIIATPESLKADIFPYDHRKTASVVKKLRDSLTTKLKNVLLYTNDEVEYITLLRWKRYQKPKHSKPSILPKPPIEPYPEGETEGETTSPPSSPPSSPTTSSPRSGQSSQGKVSQGKVSAVEEDFKKYFNSESDLTDFLMTKLTESISAARQAGAHGEQWAIAVLEEFWNQAVGKMPSGIFMGGLDALKKHPIEVVAKAFVKAARYQGGKHQKWKYIQTIIDEEVGKRKRG
ncbi:hypothetical protein ES703_125209 [subsurface metagenome]